MFASPPAINAIVLDTETTGLDQPEVIELAWQYVTPDGVRLPRPEYCQRFRPAKPITLGARAVHHISDAELANCPPSSTIHLPDDVGYIIGHNVDFDWRAIGKPNVKRICTKALVRWLHPDADSHSLGAMTYLAFPERARHLLRGAHGALVDVNNTRRLYMKLIADSDLRADWETIWAASERARVPTHMPFGKHRGMRIRELPADYRRWLVVQPDVDLYLVQALRETAAWAGEQLDLVTRP